MGQRLPSNRRFGRFFFFRVFRMRHKETKKPPVKRVANELPIIGVDRGAVKRTNGMIEHGGQLTEPAVLPLNRAV